MKRSGGVLLMSGGIDSAVCLALEIKAGRRVVPVFVNYGQPQAQVEEDCVCSLLGHFGSDMPAYIKIHLPSLSCDGLEYVLRNTILISLAANHAYGIGSNKVITGIRNSGFTDTTPLFVSTFGAMVWTMTNDRVKLICPIFWLSKQQVIAEARELGVPLHLTYSCMSSAEPCGKCPSCLERQKAGV